MLQPWVQSRGLGFFSLLWSWWSSCVLRLLCFFYFLCCLPPPCLWQLQPACGIWLPSSTLCSSASLYLYFCNWQLHSGTHTRHTHIPSTYLGERPRTDIVWNVPPTASSQTSSSAVQSSWFHTEKLYQSDVSSRASSFSKGLHFFLLWLLVKLCV